MTRQFFCLKESGNSAKVALARADARLASVLPGAGLTPEAKLV